MSDPSIIDTWRRIIVGEGKGWVVFAEGTCVVLTQPTSDPAAQATSLLREWGPVHVGSPAADFNVITLSDLPGWVVTCHHPDIIVHVSPDDVGERPSDLIIGLLGRSRRDADAQALEVLHVESARE